MSKADYWEQAAEVAVSMNDFMAEIKTEPDKKSLTIRIKNADMQSNQGRAFH